MKRSEFYAMMIIVIIMCSMSTVFAVSYQPQIIQPTKPYMATLNQTSAAENTYYTICDITGRGITNYIGAILPDKPSGGIVTLKITLDGAVYTISPESTTNNILSGEMTWITNGAAGYGANIFSLVFKTTLYFKNSLKIEAKHSGSGGTFKLAGTVNYALE